MLYPKTTFFKTRNTWRRCWWLYQSKTMASHLYDCINQSQGPLSRTGMPNTKGWHQWLFREHPSAPSIQTILGSCAESLPIYRLIASDDEFSLFSVVTFRRVHDDFVQKCREQKWVAFISLLQSWLTRLLGLSSVNLFMMKKKSLKNSKIWRWREWQRRSYGCAQVQNLVWHKTDYILPRRSFCDFLGRISQNHSKSWYTSRSSAFSWRVSYGMVYQRNTLGLLSRYRGSFFHPVTTSNTYISHPDPKNVKKLFNVLQTHFASLRPRSNAADGKKLGAEDFIGEYQTLMDQEFFDFVLYEVPWIIT